MIMKARKILVLGATGKTGRKVAERLVKKGHEVRMGSRSASPAFDWENSDTWPGAVEGMDTVYIAFQPDLALPGAKEAIRGFSQLAVDAGVQKLVILSGRGEKEAQECEEIVIHSGVDWAVIRCDWFNQNFSESFLLEPILAGHLTLPRAEAKIPLIDTDDIADVAVEAITKEEHTNKIHELTGPRLLTFSEVATHVSKATGREIAFQPVTLEQYSAMMEEHNVPKPFIQLVNYLFSELLDGRNAHVTDGVERVLGRKPKDFSEYAREMAASGIWDPVEAKR